MRLCLPLRHPAHCAGRHAPDAKACVADAEAETPQAARWSSCGGSPTGSMSPVALRPTFASGLPCTPLPLYCLLHQVLDTSFGRYVRLEDAAPEQVLEPAERLDGLPRHLLLRQP